MASVSSHDNISSDGFKVGAYIASSERASTVEGQEQQRKVAQQLDSILQAKCWDAIQKLSCEELYRFLTITKGTKKQWEVLTFRALDESTQALEKRDEPKFQECFRVGQLALEHTEGEVQTYHIKKFSDLRPKAREMNISILDNSAFRA